MSIQTSKGLIMRQLITNSSMIVVILLSSSCSQDDNFTLLKGPYLGQKPPGRTAEIFAPGIVSTGFNEHGISFTPDGRELYFRILGLPRGVIYCMKMGENEKWTKPVQAPFLKGYDAKCSLSPDGNKVVFSTSKPRSEGDERLDHWEIWVAERQNDNWGEPANIGLKLGYDVACPSISNNGNIYFYSESISGGFGNGDIYLSKYEVDTYSEPINLGSPINTEYWENDPYIAPDESFIIFQSDREGDHEFGDLYISYKDKNGKWIQPINMGDNVNSSTSGEGCPWVTPDGKYLFFSSLRSNHPDYRGEELKYETKMKIMSTPGNGSEDIFWVDANIIEQLRSQVNR